MNKLVTKILKESGVSAKITSDTKRPKFRIKNNQLTLEGIVTDKKYSMKITDMKGAVIDELSVAVKDGNDIANRINESILTLNKLSPIYDNHVRLKEDEEFEEIPEVTVGDIYGALKELDNIYTSLMDLAERTNKVLDYFEDDDISARTDIIEFVGSLYDIALNIDEYKNDTLEELQETETATESYKPVHTPITASKKALSYITIAEATLQGHKKYKDIQKTLKDIKSELIVKGR